MPHVAIVWRGPAALGESPFWSIEEQCVYFADIRAGRLHRFDPATGHMSATDFDRPLGVIAPALNRKLLLGLGQEFMLFDPRSRELSSFAKTSGPRHWRFNDGRCDRFGRLWCGFMSDPPDPAAAGRILRLNPDGTFEQMFGGVITPNGIAFSQDSRRLFFADSHPTVRTIWTSELDAIGQPVGKRERFAVTKGIHGRPDGAMIDNEGCYWSAAADGGDLVRYMSDGCEIDRIGLPVRKPTMACFGGTGLNTIFVTTAKTGLIDDPLGGALLALSVGVQGLPEHVFAA